MQVLHHVLLVRQEDLHKKLGPPTACLVQPDTIQTRMAQLIVLLVQWGCTPPLALLAAEIAVSALLQWQQELQTALLAAQVIT